MRAWLPATRHVYQMKNVLEVFVRVPCSIAPLRPGLDWIVVNEPRDAAQAMLWIEARFGRRSARERHDVEWIAKARSARAAQLSSFRGLANLFVPIMVGDRCDAVIAAGPFLAKFLDAGDIQGQWADLGGRADDPYDRELAAYVRAALDLPQLEPGELAAFRELLQILARAISGAAKLPSDMDRVSDLRRTVFGRTLWARQYKANLMLDPLSNAVFGDRVSTYSREELGLTHMPNTVLALMPDEQDARSGVVRELVRVRAFQRDAVGVSRKLDDTLSAPLEDHGAYFLFHTPQGRNPARMRLWARDRAQAIAERVQKVTGLGITVGVSGVAQHTSELPECARRATVALQLAAHAGERSLLYDDALDGKDGVLDDTTPAAYLVRLLGAFKARRSGELEALQDGYVRAALLDSGGRGGRIRAHLELALGALLAELRSDRAIDRATSAELGSRLRQSLEQAASSAALTNAFRDGASLLARMSVAPRRGRVELRWASLARFITEHCAEPLSRTALARRAGLSESYFSFRFKAALGCGFEHYLRLRRLDRAKHLLQNSSLAVQQVAYASGFASVTHFGRVFREAVGTTPSAYRSEPTAKPKRTHG